MSKETQMDEKTETALFLMLEYLFGSEMDFYLEAVECDDKEIARTCVYAQCLVVNKWLADNDFKHFTFREADKDGYLDEHIPLLSMVDNTEDVG